jgi:large subunit ribosomal protein L9
MKIVLLQDIPTLGLSGEIKNVANGYGRNYLIPNRFAALATASIIKQTETKRQEAAVRWQKIEEDQKQLAERINNVTVELKAKAGLEKHLYGSITNADIARELSKVVGVEIDRKKVALTKPIRQLGSYDVIIRFNANVAARIKVIVHPEDEETPAEEAEVSVAQMEVVAVTVIEEQVLVAEATGEEVKDVPGEATAS